MAVKFKKGVDLSNQRGVNVADPTSATDAANKQYVDNLVSGLSYKNEVRVATTTNGALATAYENGDTVDGVVLATGDRILLKDQTTQTENGIYVVAVSGVPTRATDADSTAELNNATVYVTNGTVNGGREYTQTTANPTVGSSNLVFVQKTSGISYTADGNGIELSSTQFALELDGTTLSKSASGLRIGSGAAGAGLVEASGVLAVGAGTGITVAADSISIDDSIVATDAQVATAVGVKADKTTTVTAGAGLTGGGDLSANRTLDVGAGTGISVAADAVSIDTSVVVRKFAADCVVTTNPQTFTHGLGTDITIDVWEDTEKVFPDVTKNGTSGGQVIVDWGSAPTVGQYRIVVHG